MSEKFKKELIEWIKVIATALVFAFIITQFIRPTLVRGESMYPTLVENDYLIINRMAYKIGEPKDGDIIVFKTNLLQDDGKPKDLVKRVIATEGQHIKIEDSKVYVDDKLLDEPYIQGRLKTMLEAKNLELAGCYHQEPMSYPALLAWCQKQAKEFLPYICDTGNYLDTALSSGKQIVLEAQLGAMRDIDYGIFPYTSSSTTIAAYGPIGAGIPGVQPDHVVGVLKAYSTCVGAGPFVAENAMPEEWKESLRKAGGEYGAATGRPRRVGPFDAVASRYGLKCQRADKIALTKLDVLSYMQEIPIITGYLYKGKETDTFVPTENLEEYQPVISFIPGWKQDISACRRWEELPDAAKNYIKTLEKLLDHEIQFISVGAKREEYLIKGEWL